MSVGMYGTFDSRKAEERGFWAFESIRLTRTPLQTTAEKYSRGALTSRNLRDIIKRYRIIRARYDNRGSDRRLPRRRDNRTDFGSFKNKWDEEQGYRAYDRIRRGATTDAEGRKAMPCIESIAKCSAGALTAHQVRDVMLRYIFLHAEYRAKRNRRTRKETTPASCSAVREPKRIEGRAPMEDGS